MSKRVLIHCVHGTSSLFTVLSILCTERPQEVYDNRTLYERLKQQKDKKQEEWEDQFKFSKI